MGMAWNINDIINILVDIPILCDYDNGALLSLFQFFRWDVSISMLSFLYYWWIASISFSLCWKMVRYGGINWFWRDIDDIADGPL